MKLVRVSIPDIVLVDPRPILAASRETRTPTINGQVTGRELGAV